MKAATWFRSTGLAVMTGMLIVFAFVAPTADPWTVRLMLFCLGLGVGQCNLPVNITAFANITSADTGNASAIFNMVRRAGPAFGVAILSTVLAMTDGHRLLPDAHAFKVAFIACAAIGLVGAISALFIRDSDVESTMKVRSKAKPAPDVAVPATDIVRVADR